MWVVSHADYHDDDSGGCGDDRSGNVGGNDDSGDILNRSSGGRKGEYVDVWQWW